jgi:DNA polymerase-3 subunit delta'
MGDFMSFDAIKKSQPNVVTLLENSILKDRLSHAYLFEGEPGTKKFETALYFAQMLLCTSEKEKPCLVCHNCKRIAQGIHPNVYVIEPIKGMIRKNQIQELQIEFSKTAVEPGKKVYIIRDIDTINVAAANSLLKFLEEPFAGVHAILTTSNIRRTLSTIVSRSQVISFRLIDKKIIQNELEEAGYQSDRARVLSHLTNNTNKAIDLANNEYFEDVLESVHEIYEMLSKGEKGLPIYFEQNFSIIYQERESISLFLDCMILFQKDILHLMSLDKVHIVFQEKLGVLEALSLQKTKEKRIQELERMLDLQGRLRSYINSKLALDNLFLDLERG